MQVLHRCGQLQVLNLWRCGLATEGVLCAALGGLSKLRVLELRFCTVSEPPPRAGAPR